MKPSVLHPHGFCAGVKAALETARRHPGAYCLHEIVHNELVVGELAAKGMKFVESLDDVPDGETVIFSAHGVSPSIRAKAQEKHLKVIDATCPFVAKVHKEARLYASQGMDVVVIGHKGHAEVNGIVGEVEAMPGAKAYVFPDEPAPGSRIGVVSQTTMNSGDVASTIALLKTRHDVHTSADVCHATKERQDAVKAFEGDALVVLGGAKSSNTRRLVEVAKCPAFRVGTMEELEALDLSIYNRIGVTAGASTPDSFLEEAMKYLNEAVAPTLTTISSRVAAAERRPSALPAPNS